MDRPGALFRRSKRNTNPTEISQELIHSAYHCAVRFCVRNARGSEHLCRDFYPGHAMFGIQVKCAENLSPEMKGFRKHATEAGLHNIRVRRPRALQLSGSLECF